MTTQRTSLGHRAVIRRSGQMTAILLTALTALSCGSDDSDGAATNAPSSVVVANTTPTSLDDASSLVSSTPSPPSEVDASPLDADVVAHVAKYLDTPEIDLEPLAARPAPGKKIIFIQNSPVPADLRIMTAAVEAAELLGWETSIITYKGDPASKNAAMEQAVREGPDAIVLGAADPREMEGPFKAATDAGIIVVTHTVIPEPTGVENGGLAGVVGGPSRITEAGTVYADWLIADSEGDANVALFVLSQYPILTMGSDALQARLKEKCPDCKSTVVNMQLSDIGTAAPGIVVSTLQADPDIDYIWMCIGDLSIGVTAALESADLQDIQVLSNAPSAENIQGLRDKREVMAMTVSEQLTAYMTVDLVARYMETGQPVTSSQPMQIFTQDNVPATGSPITPPDYVEQFKKLWHLDG